MLQGNKVIVVVVVAVVVVLLWNEHMKRCKKSHFYYAYAAQFIIAVN